jgi:5-methylcytosine-specific restriction endonuclease McrA
MRECNTCHVSKPLAEYNRAAHCKDGYQYKCRACVRAWGVEYRERNAEEIRARKKAYQLAHPEQRRAGEIRYYQRHARRHWECTNRRVKVRRRIDPIFRQKKLDNCRAHYLKRYGVELVALAALFDSQLGRCANPYCQKSLKESCELDHIMPLALGGTHDLRNLQFLCLNCNRRKNKRRPNEWLEAESSRR